MIQNEIISIYNKLILKNLFDNVNEAKCFTVLAEETTDISNKEQLSLCVRYLDKNQKKIEKIFYNLL